MSKRKKFSFGYFLLVFGLVGFLIYKTITTPVIGVAIILFFLAVFILFLPQPEKDARFSTGYKNNDVPITFIQKVAYSSIVAGVGGLVLAIKYLFFS